MDQNVTAHPLAPDRPAAPEATTSSAVLPPGAWSPSLAASAILVASLAFLLGSFRATNADIWLTLATGKLLAAGEYQFGVDPFSWASAGSYWANPSWLSSWLAYALYQHIGPASLVFMKALLIVVTAGFLFAARARDSSRLVSIELTALAIVVASPRFLLQSTVISFAVLAVLLWYLTHSGFLGGLAVDEKSLPSHLWHLPLLFLAWSNLDAFFILGLALLALVALGLGINAATRPQAARLGLALGLSTAASALNPHLFANFTLPTELAYLFQDVLPASMTAAGRTAAALNEGDPGFYLIVSPFSSVAITNSNFGANIAGFCFHLLVLINIASFVACFFVPEKKALAARALACIAFGLLAGLQIRLVPFYAFVAAPVSVLNFSDYARVSRRVATLPGGGIRFARLMTLSFLLLAVFLAWPGWLHLGFAQFQGDSLFQSNRRVDWELEPDPSLHQAALALRGGARAGEIHNVLNFVPEIAHYCAFFTPEVKCGIDLRLALFAPKAREYAALRNDLWADANEFVDEKLKRTKHAWPKTFAEWNVDTLVISNYNRVSFRASGPLVFAMFHQPTLWKPIVADGQTLVERYSADRPWPEDYLFSKWRREAFAPRPEADWLPADAPLIPPRETNWLDLYARGAGPTPPSIHSAIFAFDAYQKYKSFWLPPYFAAFQTLHVLPAAGHAGAVPGHVLGLQAAHVAALGEYAFRHPIGNELTWFHSTDLGPAALPILATRDLRRAINKNPNLAANHALLAQTVKLTVAQETWWNRHQSPSLRLQLRSIEIAAALRNAVNLEPHKADFHVQMADALFTHNFRDAALLHMREALQTLDDAHGPDLNPAKKGADRRATLDKQVKSMESDLKKRRDDFDLKSAGVSDMNRFRIAIRDPWRYTDLENRTHEDPRGRGLALLGLQILEKINPANLTDEEKNERNFFLVRLNCFQGKINEAVAIYNEAKNELGGNTVEGSAWIAAGTGWYKNLDEALGVREAGLAAHMVEQAPHVRAMALRSLGLNLLTDLPTAARIGFGVFTEHQHLIQQDNYYDAAMRLADYRTLRGLYALERGDVVRARVHFDQAIASDLPFLDRPIALRYSQLLRQAAPD